MRASRRIRRPTGANCSRGSTSSTTRPASPASARTASPRSRAVHPLGQPSWGPAPVRLSSMFSNWVVVGYLSRRSANGAPLARWRVSLTMRAIMLSNSALQPVRMQYALALCGALALSACSSKYATVPARLDLAPYGRIAVIAFTTEQSNSAMSTLATQRFAEALLASQRVSSFWSSTPPIPPSRAGQPTPTVWR